MRGFVTDPVGLDTPVEQSVVELVQTHPLLMLQMGMFLFSLFNVALQMVVKFRSASASKEEGGKLSSSIDDLVAAAKQRRGIMSQTMWAMLVSKAIDIFFMISIDAIKIKEVKEINEDKEDKNSSTSKAKGHGDQSEKEKKEKQARDGESKSGGASFSSFLSKAKESVSGFSGSEMAIIDGEYVKQARAAARALVLSREGQIFSFLLLAIICCSSLIPVSLAKTLKAGNTNRHPLLIIASELGEVSCVAAVLVRALPFFARIGALLLATLNPEQFLPLVAYAPSPSPPPPSTDTDTDTTSSDAKKDKKAKMKRRKQEQSYRQKRSPLAKLLFPLDNYLDLRTESRESRDTDKYHEDSNGGIETIDTLTASADMVSLPLEAAALLCVGGALLSTMTGPSEATSGTGTGGLWTVITSLVKLSFVASYARSRFGTALGLGSADEEEVVEQETLSGSTTHNAKNVPNAQSTVKPKPKRNLKGNIENSDKLDYTDKIGKMKRRATVTVNIGGSSGSSGGVSTDIIASNRTRSKARGKGAGLPGAGKRVLTSPRTSTDPTEGIAKRKGANSSVGVTNTNTKSETKTGSGTGTDNNAAAAAAYAARMRKMRAVIREGQQSQSKGMPVKTSQVGKKRKKNVEIDEQD